MKADKILLLSALLFAMSFAAQARAQEFRVRVLDALNGKPYSGVGILYICDGQYVNFSREVMTDNNGLAEVPFDCGENVAIELHLWTASHTIYDSSIEECGALPPQPIKRILELGVISNPSGAGGIWCPKRISKKLKPTPGEVIMFVKKPTWWQRNIAP